MSRTAAKHNLPVTRGATWEDEFTYEDETGAPVDLTGFEARMHVRTPAGQFGLSTTETLVMALTTGADGRLVIDTPAGGTVPNRVRIAVDAADTVDLNPDNRRRVKLVYSLELYRPEAVPDPEYVIPLVEGVVTVGGEVTR